MKFLKTLREKNVKRSAEWAGEQSSGEKADDLLFRSVELAGEAGEVCNDVKKLVRYIKGMKGGVPLKESIQKIANELADVIICVDRVADSLDIDLEKAVIQKFNDTSLKHGFKTTMAEEDTTLNQTQRDIRDGCYCSGELLLGGKNKGGKAELTEEDMEWALVELLRSPLAKGGVVPPSYREEEIIAEMIKHNPVREGEFIIPKKQLDKLKAPSTVHISPKGKIKVAKNDLLNYGIAYLQSKLGGVSIEIEEEE